FIGENLYDYNIIYSNSIDPTKQIKLYPVKYETQTVCPEFNFYDLRTQKKLEGVKLNIDKCIDMGAYSVSFEKPGYLKKTEELFLTNTTINIPLEKNAKLTVISDTIFEIEGKEYLIFNNINREIILEEGNYFIKYKNMTIPINVNEGRNLIDLTKLQNEQGTIEKEEQIEERTKWKEIYTPVILILCVIFIFYIISKKIREVIK
ncbi:MAG: hypothetical protein WC356_07030, partial [Candidatus Micrarchaeia archaeon]